ncbi:MAG: DUF3829 domain-containing protein [Sphingomonas sp.]|jgi:hypothetical protein|uniref:DUF3829 domain-containing protein n=1 Tax=Sphingomonas sp. TaxID=28214 RepID=UPI0035636696
MQAGMVRRGLALAGLLVLGACGPTGGAGNEATAVAADSSPAAAAKISAYTDAYNALLDTYGLPVTVQTYKEANIARRSPADDISISQGWIENAEGKLKAARALPGSLGALDAAAAKLDDALTKVLARLEPLYAYYNAKSYRQDGLERGRREDAQMIAEFDAAITALNDFNTALLHQRHARVESELAALKQRGDTLGYTNKLAMQQAEDLVGLFKKPADLNDPAVLGKADTLAASIEALLSEQQKSIASARTKAVEPVEKSRIGMYGVVADLLGSMVGQYRQLKQSHSASDMQSTVDAYNRAVSAANGIP